MPSVPLTLAAFVTAACVWALAWTGFAGARIATADRVRVHVEGGHIRFGPTDLRLRVVVDRRADHRSAGVILDGGSWASESQWTLDGEDSARVKWLTYRHVPPGDYTVIAAVVCDTGAVCGTDRADVRVIDPRGDGQGSD